MAKRTDDGLDSLSKKISDNRYKDCLNGIKACWKELTFFVPKDRGIHIGLPHKFVAPSVKGGIFKQDQFYWDSYFIVLGLIVSNKVSLAKGMVDNFVYMQKRFGIIPSRNRFFNLGISQPPFLSSMVREVFKATQDKKWLREMAKVIENEIVLYWMDGQRTEKHLAYAGLSRYCDHYINDITAEHESGWDMTSRFSDRCLNYLPVDLNSLLYKYEIDLAEIYKTLGNSSKGKIYLARAAKRRKTISKLMWDERKGFFFDYNYKLKKQGGFYSLAGFYPLWSGLATKEQARKARAALKKFEYQWGLANTQKSALSKDFRQWDYPNGWANQQWIVIKGLLNYGYEDDARRLAEKWLDLNAKVFSKTGKFWEKYNVVTGDVGKRGRYPNQTGFGWTNAVFVKLVKEFEI